MFPYDNGLSGMLGEPFLYKKAQSFRTSGQVSDKPIEDIKPSLSIKIQAEQQRRWSESLCQISTALQRQLHRKLYREEFYGPGEELFTKLKKNAPKELDMITKDVLETWAPYLWKQMFYGAPYDPQHLGSPQKTFPRYYSSILASLLGESKLFPLRQI